MKYTITCKNCGKEFESDSNRSKYCAACFKTMRGRRNTKYRDQNYDRFTYYMPIGHKAMYQAIAKHLDISLNEFITTAVWEYMDKLDKEKKLDDIPELQEE
ncbi:MAG: hypothetical protein LUF89_08825 [Ruminococcus sp.]|nr:hypothetical protein [Ruminococcus sp.]